MRIALLTHAFPPDNEHGIPRYVYELANALGKRNHCVEVIAGCPEAGRNPERTENFNINWVHQSPSFSKYTPVYGQLKLSYRIRKTLLALHREQPFDIVEFPNYKLSGFASAVHGLPKPSPAFISRLSSPGSVIPKSGISPWRLGEVFEKFQVRKLSGVIGNTADNLAICQKAYNLDPNLPKTVILHGLPAGTAPKLHYNHPCRNIGLFLGRIEPRKGFDTLATAWDLVVKKVPDARLLVAGVDQPWKGHDSYFSYCLSNLPPKTLKQIEYLGFVGAETKEQLLAGCDIFIAPSRYESFGLVFLEAMRYGKPVISCRTGGIPNVVSHGNTGLLVPTEDAHELALAIIDLFADNTRRQKYGNNAVEVVLKKFSQERVAIESDSFYAQLTKRIGDSDS